MGTATFAQLGTVGQTAVDDYFGMRRVKFGTITMSSSYATTGDTILVSAFGMDVIDFIDFNLAQASGGGTTAVALAIGQSITLPFGPSTGTLKIQAYWSTNAAAAFPEVSNATNLSTYSALCIVYGV